MCPRFKPTHCVSVLRLTVFIRIHLTRGTVAAFVSVENESFPLQPWLHKCQSRNCLVQLLETEIHLSTSEAFSCVPEFIYNCLMEVFIIKKVFKGEEYLE